MKNKVLFMLICILLCLLAFIFVGCGIFSHDEPNAVSAYTIQYTIEGTTHTLSVKDGMPYSIEEIPTKTGYTFAGLYDAKNGGTQYVDESGASVSAFTDKKNLVLFAQFEPIVYHVYYSIDGKIEPAEAGDTNANVEYGQPIVMNRPTEKDYYQFVGWFTESGIQISNDRDMYAGKNIVSEALFDVSDPFHAITLYAVYEAEDIELILFPNGASEASVRTTAKFNSSLAELEYYDNQNRRIDLWSTDATDPAGHPYRGNVDEALVNIYGTPILYAVPSIEVELLFDTSLGTVEQRSIRAFCGETINLPTVEYNGGVAFVGWKQDDVIVPMKYLVPRFNSPITLSAYFGDFIEIKSKEDFANIKKDMGANYVLKCDIDLGADYTPLGSYYWKHQIKDDDPSAPFHGVLDGGGHTISYQITIGNNLKNENDYAFGLFGSAKNAKFVNLNVDATIKVNGDPAARECSAGGIVGFAKNCTFENCSTSAVSSVNNQDTDSAYYAFLSGIYNQGATYAGGICGDARSCSFLSCTNNGTVYTLGYSAYVGGIAGNVTTDCILTDCVNTGSVSSSHGGWVWGHDASGSLYGKKGDPWYRSDGTTWLNKD